MHHANRVAGRVCGCSFIGVRGPGSEKPPDCTESNAAPIADTVGASVFYLYSAIGLVATLAGDSGTGPGISLPPGLVAGISGALALFGTLYTISAVHGYHATARCRKAELDDVSDNRKARHEATARANTSSRARGPRMLAHPRRRAGRDSDTRRRLSAAPMTTAFRD